MGVHAADCAILLNPSPFSTGTCTCGSDEAVANATERPSYPLPPDNTVEGFDLQPRAGEVCADCLALQAEERRQIALRMALDAYGILGVKEVIEAAKSFEAYLKGE